MSIEIVENYPDLTPFRPDPPTIPLTRRSVSGK